MTSDSPSSRDCRLIENTLAQEQGSDDVLMVGSRDKTTIVGRSSMRGCPLPPFPLGLTLTTTPDSYFARSWATSTKAGAKTMGTPGAMPPPPLFSTRMLR